MAAKPEGPRRPSVDDMALFERAMRDARRLERERRQPRPQAEPRPPALRPQREKPKPRLAPPPAAVTTPPEPAAPPYVVERRVSVPGLDRRTTERLARGQLPIEARLDLHGHRQADAHQALAAFILASASAGRRCVLVVTGKGQTSGAAPLMAEAAPGVLKRNLPRWLSQPPLAEKVLAIRPALPQHGGEGAFYVLLRRQRR